MILRSEDIITTTEKTSDLRRGCIVDTNVLFAASFPLDPFNEWAEGVFTTLRDLEIPVYTNINIRSEFIELNRRALIPEGLVDFYDVIGMEGDLSPVIEQKLKSLKTRKDTAAKVEKTFKLSDKDIKEFRNLMIEYTHRSGLNGWDLFCRDYFGPYIKDVWTDAVANLGIQFLGTRAIDSQTHFKNQPNWEDMLAIIGRTGIGTSDAMILNLFLNSKIPLLATADRDVPLALITLTASNSDRYVIAPN